MRFLKTMDWDEFEERGVERREYRRYGSRRPDPVTVIVASLIVLLVVTWILWAATS